MIFSSPQALLLLLPLGLWLFKRGRVTGPATWLRAALLLTLVLALADPQVVLREGGSDVVVLVDRSRSMPPHSEATAEELIRLLEPQRKAGDRLAVISFARQPRLEMPLTHDQAFGGFRTDIDAEASDLASALDAAAELFSPERSGRVLVISDGKATGLDAKSAARRLAARGVAVDFRQLSRDDAALDVAVTDLAVPSSVAKGEPFLLAASLKASSATTATLLLLRNGKPVVKTQRSLVAGDNLLTLRDLIDEPALVAYELRVEADGDAVPENDIGRAVLRVEGPQRALVLTDKPNGTLAKTLREAGIEAQVRAPGPLSMADLDQVGAVVLEDVEAGRLSENGLQVLTQYVREAGGGLVMTGGRHSFGEGGYRKSPVEDVLPVSLEVREEQRKAAVAMSIIMDCSCSMGAQVPDGRTKMELAAEGVVAALQLLNPNDEASVHMVDTGSHEIFGLSAVRDGLPLDKVARGFSGGGGIYIGEGLRTGRREILKSSKPTRHVLLFADAADSEEPDDYQKTLSTLTAQGVTVSVIGMGSSRDSDAKLLEEVALRGKGRLYFAEDVTSLPRIFSQETISVARASFVDSPVPTKLGADLGLLGKLPVTSGPGVGGYNLTYLKPQASVGLVSDDENKAPVVSMWPRGAGRVAALTAEVDGEYTGELRHWAGRRALLEQLVRWVVPAKLGALDLVARSVVRGNDLHVTVDFDARQAAPVGAPTLVVLSGDGKSRPFEMPMRWEDDDRLGAHFSLPGSGSFFPVVKWGDRVVRAPGVALPYAPEFEPGSAGAGHGLLTALAKASSGVERLSMTGLFAQAAQSEGRVPLSGPLVVAAVLLLLGEVVARRFFSVAKVSAAREAPASSPGLARHETRPRESTPTAPAAAQNRPSAAPEAPAATPEISRAASALEIARERAKRRTRR